MSPRRIAALVALCGTALLAACVAGLAGSNSGIANAGTAIEPSRPIAVSSRAKAVNGPQATTMSEDSVSADNMAIVDVTLPDSHPTPPIETPSAQLAVEAVSSLEDFDECFVAEICIDQYLWLMYRRAPKVDTISVSEQIKVSVKKKGKTRTVNKTVAKLVDEDFAWKDPKAAQKIGMPLVDYVIGGMDRSFKQRLYCALHALDDAGLSPGITSGFRDDYRQSLASGNKAATDSSYHGGSRRGGYGHGLAADLVSTNGETRSQRYSSSQKLWKWVDAHGKEFGIGRPYLDRDPPHVAPIDGKEYADHRGGANALLAALDQQASAIGGTRRSQRSQGEKAHKSAKVVEADKHLTHLKKASQDGAGQ